MIDKNLQDDQPVVLTLEESHEIFLKKFPEQLNPEKVDNKSIIFWALKRIPLFSGLIQRIDKSGDKLDDAVGKLAGDNTRLKDTSRGFHIASIVLAGLDFIRMPIVVLGALIQGKKISFSLSRTAAWIYSGAVFGLALAALFVPFAAPFIALTLAITGLITSVISMGNVFYARRQLKQEAVQLDNESKELDLVRMSLLEQAGLFKTQFSRLPEDEKIARRDQFQTQLDRVGNELKNNQAARQHCCNQQEKNKQKNNALEGPGTLLKKGFQVILASGVLVGAALSLVFPPVGAIILAACAVTGLVFALARIIVPFLTAKFNAKKQVQTKGNEGEDIQVEEQFDNTLSITRQNVQQEIKAVDWEVHPLEDSNVEVVVHEMEGNILKSLNSSLMVQSLQQDSAHETQMSDNTMPNTSGVVQSEPKEEQESKDEDEGEAERTKIYYLDN